MQVAFPAQLLFPGLAHPGGKDGWTPQESSTIILQTSQLSLGVDFKQIFPSQYLDVTALIRRPPSAVERAGTAVTNNHQRVQEVNSNSHQTNSHSHQFKTEIGNPQPANEPQANKGANRP